MKRESRREKNISQCQHCRTKQNTKFGMEGQHQDKNEISKQKREDNMNLSRNHKTSLPFSILK